MLTAEYTHPISNIQRDSRYYVVDPDKLTLRDCYNFYQYLIIQLVNDDVLNIYDVLNLQTEIFND